MPRPSVIRLREEPGADPGPKRVIDAEFKVVGRRSLLGRLAGFALALLAAALIGALIPVAWLVAEVVFAALDKG